MTTQTHSNLETHPQPPVSCEGCGKCCEHMGFPPFMSFELDILPAELAEELELVMMLEQDREDRNVPCIWLDPDTGQCKHYQYRPHVCRDFQVGGESCLLYRVRR